MHTLNCAIQIQRDKKHKNIMAMPIIHAHCETNCQLPLIDLDFDYIDAFCQSHSVRGEKDMQTAEKYIYSLKIDTTKAAK